MIKNNGYKNKITVEKKQLNLRDFNKVKKFFRKKKVDYMIMAAARAGGILANSYNQKNFLCMNHYYL